MKSRWYIALGVAVLGAIAGTFVYLRPAHSSISMRMTSTSAWCSDIAIQRSKTGIRCVTGLVRNASQSDLSRLGIVLQLFDGRGTELGGVVIWVGPINANETAEFTGTLSEDSQGVRIKEFVVP